MTLNFKSIKYNNDDFLNRIDSKYYILYDSFLELMKCSKVSISPFNDYIKFITDGEHAGQNFVKEGILFLKNSSIKDFDISVNDGFYISEQKHKLLSRSKLKSEDVLFTTIGHLGSAAIVPINFGEANMNQNFVKIEINKEKISPYYITCFLNSKLARKQINSLLTGNIQSLLTYPKIKNIMIIKPKDENVEKLIEDKYKLSIELANDAYELIKDAIKLLEDRLKLNDRNINKNHFYSISYQDLMKYETLWTPKSHYPEYLETEEYIKENFKYVFLNDISYTIKGDEPGSDLYNDYLEKNDLDVPFIRTSDVYNYQIDLSPDNFIDYHYYKEINQDVKTNDIIFTKDGKIGQTAMVTEFDKAIFGSGIELIRLNEKGKTLGLTQEYLFACIITEKIGKYTANRYTVTASTIPHLKPEHLNLMVIPIIDTLTINKITSKVKLAFSKINHKKLLIDECKNIIDDLTKQVINT